MLSQIGTRIDYPKIASAQIIMENGSIEEVRKEVREVVDKELEKINDFCMELAQGKVQVA